MLKFLGEMHLEEFKLPFLTFFIHQVIVKGHIPNCRTSLETFWIPTLREDADLTACVRYLRNPAGLPPRSVLLSKRTACIHSPVNPSEESRTGTLAVQIFGTNTESKPQQGIRNAPVPECSSHQAEVQQLTGDINGIGIAADQKAQLCNECGQFSLIGDLDEQGLYFYCQKCWDCFEFEENTVKTKAEENAVDKENKLETTVSPKQRNVGRKADVLSSRKYEDTAAADKESPAKKNQGGKESHANAAASIVPRGYHFGCIVKLVPAKQIGFIKEGKSEGCDVLFHFDRLKFGRLDPVVGDEVAFSLQTSQKAGRLAARDVRAVRLSRRGSHNVENYFSQVIQLLETRTQVLKTASSNDTDPLECLKKQRSAALAISAAGNVWVSLLNMDDLSVNTALTASRAVQLLCTFLNPFRQELAVFANDLTRANRFFAPDGVLAEAWSKFPGSACLESLVLCLVKHCRSPTAWLPVVTPLLSAVVANSKEKYPEAEMYHGVASLLMHVVETVAVPGRRSGADMETLEMMQGTVWHKLPLVPRLSEILGQDELYQLVPVLIRGAYSSTHEYLDTYFRLLRHDCFAELMDGIKSLTFGAGCLKHQAVYQGVQLLGVQLLGRGTGIGLGLKLKLGNVRGRHGKGELQHGNLLCLSAQGDFRDLLWAVVAQYDKKRVVCVELCSDSNSTNDAAAVIRLLSSTAIVMVESPTYYRAFEPALKVLQSQWGSEVDPSLPFNDIIVHANFNCLEHESTQNVGVTVDLKQVLDKSFPTTMPFHHSQLRSIRMQGGELCCTSIMSVNEAVYTIQQLMVHESRSIYTSLDEAQLSAVKAALENRVAIIQGPPGTGKTFLGVKILEVLLSMSSFPAGGQVLVLTYKNHALDEFLLKFSKAVNDGDPQRKVPSVVRVGGRSQESELEARSLRSLLYGSKKDGDLLRSLMAAEQEVDQAKEELRVAMAELGNRCASSHLSVDDLLIAADSAQLEALIADCEWPAAVHGKKAVVDECFNHSKAKVQSLLSALAELEPGVPLAVSLASPLAKCQHLQTVAQLRLQLRKALEHALKLWMPPPAVFTSLKHEPVACPHIDSVDSKANSSPSMQHDVEEAGDPEIDGDAEEPERIGREGQTDEWKDQDFVAFTRPSTQKVASVIRDLDVSAVCSDSVAAAIRQSTNVWLLDQRQRACLASMWLHCARQVVLDQVDELASSYAAASLKVKALRESHEADVIRGATVVGMTITGAAMRYNVLAQV
jgi:hypothetical protein